MPIAPSDVTMIIRVAVLFGYLDLVRGVLELD